MAVSRRTVTVLFADVADSTPLGEKLDPESLRQVMSRYFEQMAGVLERHGGTVEKFIGDAIMAVFGIPELHEDDALRAVRAATELREALARLNDELEQDIGVRIGIRVGVNTGEVVAGEGGDQHLVTGDAVNVAKRLEESARTGEILVGEATRRLVENAAVLEPRDELTLKGKAAPVVAWNVLAVIEGAPAYARRLDAPLIGRGEELRALRDAFDEAVADRTCRLVTIVGLAGIGKSRLAAELCASVREEARVLSGRCLAYGDGITFWPLVQIVGMLGSDDGLRKLLAGTEDEQLVVTRVLNAVGPTPTTAPGGELFWAVRRLFEEVAREQPLVLLVEDIHWAEPKLLDLLEYLAGWTHDAPILLLCLARPDLLETRPEWLTSQTGTALLLDPLTKEESGALLVEIGREWPLDAAARARIIEAAEGNPLYVEQMAATLAEGAPLDAIPPSIQALLAARLDRLPVEERDVLERAAVAGKDFTRRGILELSPKDEGRERTDEVLLSLVRKDLLVARPGREDAYRFRHALIRDAAYAGAPKQTRARLHERFADWASRSAAGRAGELDEIIGYHYEQAFRYRQQLGAIDEHGRELAQRAAELLGVAGRRAYARDDMPAAVNLLDRGVALISGQEPAQLALQRELSNALWSVGELSRAEALLDGLIRAAEAADDRREHWHGLLERAGRLSVTHPESVDASLETATNAVSVFEELGDDLGLAQAWRRISAVHRLRCRFATASDAGETGLVHARRAGAVQEESRLVDEICTSLLYGPAHVDDAVARCEALLAESRESRLTTANVSASLAGLNAMRGAFDEGRACIAVARRVYTDLGLRFAIAGLAQIAGTVELLADDLDAAERALREGYEILEGVGARGLLAAELARVLVAQGRFDDAGVFVTEADQASGGDLAPQVISRLARSRNAAAAGLVDQAVDFASEAAALASQTDATTLIADAHLALADALRDGGRQVESAAALSTAAKCYARKGNAVGEGAVRSRSASEGGSHGAPAVRHA